MTEQEILSVAKLVYPGCNIEIIADTGDKYYVNISSKNSDGLSDIHSIDKKSGEISGNIPTLIALKDEGLRHKIEEHYLKKSDDHLEHHGIKGQRWGERNGPPYPLDQKTHNKVVKDGSPSKKPVKKADDESQPVNGKQKAKTAQQIVEQNGDLTTELAYVGVTVAVIGAQALLKKFAINSMHKSHKKHSTELSNKYMGDYANVREFTKASPPKKIAGEHSIEDDAAAVNPLFAVDKPYTTNNCTLCATTYDLRRRGYDVTAKMCDNGMVVKNTLKDIYEGAKDIGVGSNTNTWDDVKKFAVKKFPEGSRGHISIRSPFASLGHSMAWEIKGGKLRVIDPQSNDTNVDLNSDLFKLWGPSMTSFTRLDNLKVKTEGMSTVCAELKDNWKSKVPKKASKNTDSVLPGSDTQANVPASTSGRITDYQRYAANQYKKEHPNTKMSEREIIEMLSKK